VMMNNTPKIRPCLRSSAMPAPPISSIVRTGQQRGHDSLRLRGIAQVT
jgi:hypothetical protein